MKINNAKKIIILFLVILSIIILIGLFAMSNRNLINNILGIKIEQEEVAPLFSYVVYDNQDEQNIKVLITVNSENGIEYIEYPDGKVINGYGKNTFSIDYLAAEGIDYKFNIKEMDKEEVEEIININNEITKTISLGINIINNIAGYKELKLENKISIDNYDDIYYKISENGEWIEATELATTDYDLLQNGFVEEDNTVTIYAKMVNNITNDTVIVNSEKINVDTTQVSESIQANSLIEAISSESIQTGKYEVTVSDEIYTLKVYNIDEDLEINSDMQIGVEEDVATADTYAQNMVILKVDGDLTINEGATLTSYASKNGYGGTKGMMIYCTGTLTNNGEISMTARGAYAEGQNVYLWQNSDETYEYVPAVGADRGTSVKADGYSISITGVHQVEGISGNNGLGRQTGGGGSGGAAAYRQLGNGRSTATSGDGGVGTSYSGGTGGGAAATWHLYQYLVAGAGSSNGGAGGLSSQIIAGTAGSGAGNPGTGTGDSKGENGTGGLLIIYTNNFNNQGTISSDGSTGGIGNITTSNNSKVKQNASGGSSGGGSINIFYKAELKNIGTIEAFGGEATSASNGSTASGGAGGTGSISFGQILDGTYISTYTNY